MYEWSIHPRVSPSIQSRHALRAAGLLAVLIAALVLAARGAAAPGDLDSRFGEGGSTVMNFGGQDGARAVTVMPDGRIVAGGSAGLNFGVARLRAGGGRDPSFGGGDGLVDLGFGAADHGNDLAVDTDGRIVVAGETDAAANPSNFALIRFDVDGTPDPAFTDGVSGNGRVLTDFGDDDQALGVAIAPDGKAVAAGRSGPFPSGDFAVARYDEGGTPDAGFGGTGLVTTDFGDFEVANAVAVDPDGRVVAAGRHQGILPYFALARYEEDGDLDATFGDAGLVSLYFAGLTDEVSDVALTRDGRIVVAGTSGNRLAVARFMENGTPDPSFGAEGRVTIDFGLTTVGRAVAVAPRGRILIAGTASSDLVVAQLNANGSRDRRFGTRGVARIDLGGSEGAWDVALAPDGGIVVAGTTSRGPDPPNFLLARLANPPRIVKLIPKRRLGIARAVIEIPAPGRVKIRRTKKLRRAAGERESAGRLRLRLTPRGKAKRRLARRRCEATGKRRLRVRVRAKVVHRPPLGLVGRTQRRVRLVRRC